MIDFIKRMFGYKSLEQTVNDIVDDIKANASKQPFPVIVSGISRCIIDIKQLKPVSISIETRGYGAVYIRIDRLDAENNIVSKFYDYTQEDHIRIMKEFQEYLNTQSTKQIVA